MVLTDDVADGTRGFPVGLVPLEPVLVHRVEDAPVHGFQAVARIWQRTRHDHAYGVIEVAALHLVEDGYGTNIGGRRRLAGLVIFGIGQGGIRVSGRQNHIADLGSSNHFLKRPQKRFFPSFFHGLTGLARTPELAFGEGFAEPWNQALFQCPKTTACMIRPGMKVNSPAMTSAPANSPSIVVRCRRTLCPRAATTPTTSMTGT